MANSCSSIGTQNRWAFGMRRLLFTVLRNERGFTPSECGIIAGLIAIFAEKLLVPF